MKKKEFWQFKNIVQEHTSKNTSININKMPKTVKLIEPILSRGQTWADIGGGRFDNTVEHFKKFGAKLHVFDPFNRSKEHNDMVVEKISNSQCDGVMINNVLNVIAEKENRKKVIQQAFDCLKDGAKAYFLIYEGDKTGKAKVTKKTNDSSSFQLNQKAQFFEEEIKEVFGNQIERKGAFFIVQKKLSLELIDSDKEIFELKKKAKSLGITRYGKCGKLIGGSLYVHKQYADILPKEQLIQALVHLRNHLPQFEYTIIKYIKENGSFSFIKSSDFDTKAEPTVQDAILVNSLGEISYTKTKKDPQIYHHKWVFVADDYTGFDVKQSINRSIEWKSKLGTNKEISSKIGTLSFWQQWLQSVGLKEDSQKIKNKRK